MPPSRQALARLRRRALGLAAARLALILALLAVWELIGISGRVSHVVLVPASTVLQFLSGELASGRIWPQLWLTLYEVLLAFVLASVAGLAVGFAVGTTRPWRLAVEPILAALFATPLVLLYNIFAIWFGIGPLSKITFGAMYGFFPIALNTIAGINNVDRMLLRAARAMGASPLQLYSKVLFPAALPALLAGLRSGASLALIGVLVGEMLLAKQGIGFLLNWSSFRLATTEMFAYVVIAILFSLAFNEALRWVEGRASTWRHSA